jgi:2-oxoglutarate/2-oxoacid ferredoxin oxidoreductase subunit beta
MQKTTEHPQEKYLRSENLPTVWCSGCGIGSALHAFIDALDQKNVSPNKILLATGLGCTQKVGDYLNLKSFSLSHGRAVEFSRQYLSSHSGELVFCFLNNADFMLTGATDFLTAGETKESLVIIYINNFIYTISGNDGFPMTPYLRRSSDGKFELPFNIPLLAQAAGAKYCARWSPLREGWLKYSLVEAMDVKGLSVIEVINPCLIYDSSGRRLLSASERMQFYDSRTHIADYSPAEKWDIRNPGPIILGTFFGKNTGGEETE